MDNFVIGLCGEELLSVLCY